VVGAVRDVTIAVRRVDHRAVRVAQRKDLGAIAASRDRHEEVREREQRRDHGQKRDEPKLECRTVHGRLWRTGTGEEKPG